jgi:hypothetical protein
MSMSRESWVREPTRLAAGSPSFPILPPGHEVRQQGTGMDLTDSPASFDLSGLQTRRSDPSSREGSLVRDAAHPMNYYCVCSCMSKVLERYPGTGLERVGPDNVSLTPVSERPGLKVFHEGQPINRFTATRVA